MPDPKKPTTAETGTARSVAKSAAKPAAAAAATAAKPAPTPGAKPTAAKPAASEPAAAAKPAAAKPVAAQVPANVADGGEENPLHKKLRLRPEDSGVVIAPPTGDDNPLLPLPQSFLTLGGTADLAKQTGPFDYVHVFARDRADLVEDFTLMVEKLSPAGSLWVSWLKPSSKMKGGGQPGDLNENIVRRIALTHGLVDVNLVVLDRDWSALRLVRRKR